MILAFGKAPLAAGNALNGSHSHRAPSSVEAVLCKVSAANGTQYGVDIFEQLA